MALAVTLAESDSDVIVMDREESSIREMRNYTDYAFVTSDLSMESLKEAGIHNCDVVIVCIGAEVIYPERDMALRLGRRLLSGNFLDYIPLDHSVQITQIRIPERMTGKTVEQIQLRRKYGLNIIAVIGKVDNINTFEKSL